VAFFENNRKKFLDKLPEDAIAIFDNGDTFPRNGDVDHPFRANNNFYYLTGIEEWGAKLIISPQNMDGDTYRLYIPPQDPKIEVWTGKRLTIEDSQELSGIQKVEQISSFNKDLNRLLYIHDTIYVDYNENSLLGPASPFKSFIQELKNAQPGLDFKRASRILTPIRAIKTPEEIDCLKKACSITGEALNMAWSHLEAGRHEYEIQAVIEFVMTMNKCQRLGYEPIVASGKNAAILHYITNNDPLAPNDLILFDVGAEWNQYSADITRTVPVSGKFEGMGKEVYEAVLEVQNEIIPLLKPGAYFKDVIDKSKQLIAQKLLDLKWIQDLESDESKELIDQYYPHKFGHFLGMNVHDVGFANLPMEAGQVWTVEPGIYDFEREIGVRIEDDILITNSQPEILSKMIPREIKDIEHAISTGKEKNHKLWR